MTQIIKCFIASPSDTLTERDICDRVFSDINRSIGQFFQFRIESLKWENDVRPAFGSDGQSVINQQIGSDYQIFIGIMHKKFGTATLQAGSGTEEEFNNAYKRYKDNEDVEIMFYFNDEPPLSLSDINPTQLEKVNNFKTKVADLGGLYCQYNGHKQFEQQLRKHLDLFFLKTFNQKKSHDLTANKYTRISGIFEERLNDSLKSFSSQPIIWINPTISKHDELSKKADDETNHVIDINTLINNPHSAIIKAAPQFGLTCLSHFLAKEAWKTNSSLWLYLDVKDTKSHKLDKLIKKELQILDCEESEVKCIILDSWTNTEKDSVILLRNLCNTYPKTPIITMQTLDDSKFLEHQDDDNIPEANIKINRDFENLFLLPFSRQCIRQMVSDYNKSNYIGEKEIVTTKIVNDLDALNIHRTPINCLTLLKVSERNFDESPVNRTKMLDMVLNLLFNSEISIVYDIKPDLKDCEYVLGKFCEKIIRNGEYYFTKEFFLNELKQICDDKLIELDIDIVFNILHTNNILYKRSKHYCFKTSYWLFYFAALRMHHDQNFCDYILKNKKYVSYPEIIEFYTGIDRRRNDAINILCNDLKEICETVDQKVGLPDEMNPYRLINWNPTQEHLVKMQDDITNNVLNSNLPDEVKDKHADQFYDNKKAYNQSINDILHEYSVVVLMQNIKAASRALRNSDYIDTNIKKDMLNQIMISWEILSKVVLALTPYLAAKGNVNFEGASFMLYGNFGDTFEDRINTVLQNVHFNIVSWFRNDIYSPKLGPLFFHNLKNETNEMKKHELALLLIYERPKGWKDQIQEYITSISKNSFYLFDTFNSLRTQYRYSYASSSQLKEIEYLIKMGLAKHEFGDKKPGIDKIIKISNKVLPKRESEAELD